VEADTLAGDVAILVEAGDLGREAFLDAEGAELDGDRRDRGGAEVELAEVELPALGVDVFDKGDACGVGVIGVGFAGVGRWVREVGDDRGLVEGAGEATAGVVGVGPVEGAAGGGAEADEVVLGSVELEFTDDQGALLAVFEVVDAVVAVLIAIALGVGEGGEVEPACGEGLRCGDWLGRGRDERSERVGEAKRG